MRVIMSLIAHTPTLYVVSLQSTIDILRSAVYIYIETIECDARRQIQMIEAGKTYLINCQRKGTFVARLTDVGEEWATGVIVAGRSSAMMEYNARDIGEEVTVRRSFCRFTEQP